MIQPPKQNQFRAHSLKILSYSVHLQANWHCTNSKTQPLTIRNRPLAMIFSLNLAFSAHNAMGSRITPRAQLLIFTTNITARNDSILSTQSMVILSADAVLQKFSQWLSVDRGYVVKCVRTKTTFFARQQHHLNISNFHLSKTLEPVPVTLWLSFQS